MAPQCSFNLHFSNYDKVEHLFICLSTIFISFGGVNCLFLFLIFYPIFGPFPFTCKI